jgi:hypothetical protein
MRSWLAPAAVLALLATDAAAWSSTEFVNLETGTQVVFLEDGALSTTEQVQPGTVIVDGVATKRVRVVAGVDVGWESFYTNDGSGFRLHRIVAPPPDSDGFLMNTPIVALPGTFTTGQSFAQNDAPATYFFPGVGSFPMQYDISSQVVGIETVVVPAGTFTALRVDSTLVMSGTIFGEFVSTASTSSDWYVRHLLAVKSAGEIDGEPYTTELTSHNVVLCGDLTQNGVVAASDVALYRSVLAGAAAFTSPQLARCNAIAPTACDVRDLTVLRREVSGPLLAPGASRACVTP